MLSQIPEKIWNIGRFIYFFRKKRKKTNFKQSVVVSLFVIGIHTKEEKVKILHGGKKNFFKCVTYTCGGFLESIQIL